MSPGWQSAQAVPTQAIVLQGLGEPQEPVVEQVMRLVSSAQSVLPGMQSTHTSSAQAWCGQSAGVPQVPAAVQVENRVGSFAAHCVSPG
jgi:hypothetical protein